MDRPTPALETAVRTAAHNATRPRRRWSDGPNYPWTASAPDGGAGPTPWPAVAALLCEQISTGVHEIQQRLDRLEADGRLSRNEGGSVRRHAESLHRAGVTVQQIVRLGAGSVNPAGECVELADLAKRVLHDRQADLLLQGAHVEVELRPAEVLLDPSVGVELFNAALNWALSFSDSIKLKIEATGPSSPVRISVRGSLAPAAGGRAGPGRRDRRMNANLHWYLFRQLAVCAKLRISRSSTGATESAVLEFPRPYEFADGVAMVELLPGGSQAPLEDAWVLAIVRDQRLREKVLRLLLVNGIEASVAQNCERARALCGNRKPNAIVSCHESMGARQLCNEFILDDLQCAHIQIVRAKPSFEASGFAGHEQIRVARSDLEKELIPALLFELAQQA